jgi:hypothetical protein
MGYVPENTVNPAITSPRFLTNLTPWQKLLLVIIGGLVVGVVTMLGQSVLPGDLNTLVNSGAIWALFAFLFSSLMPSNKWAAVAGFLTLIGTVFGYYAGVQLILDIQDVGGAGFWGLVALVAGPIFGVAGRWWRTEKGILHVLSIGLLGGVFAAEGIQLLRGAPNKILSGWLEIGIGILIVLILGRSLKAKGYGLAILPLIVALGALAYFFLNWAITTL